MKCGGKTRSGGQCQHPAGWGTDHVGEGRCKLHGGASLYGVNHPNFKHGRYSVKHRQALATKTDLFLNDPAPYDVDSELALMRALLQEYLDRFVDGEKLPAHEITSLMSMLESIARMVERITKMLNQTALTQAEVQYLKARMVDELPNYIPDAGQQVALVRAIFGTVGA